MTTWTTVEPSAELAQRYRSRGWWDGETLATLLSGALKSAATREFRVHSQERPWRGSISDVADQARRLAAGLRARGIGPGDAVAFQLPNSAEAAAVFYGLAMAGAVLVPIGHTLGASELRFAIRASGARALVVSNWQKPGFPFDVLDGLDALEYVIAVGDLPDAVVRDRLRRPDRSAPLAAPAVVDPASPAVIGWTSGTTGSPKGVLLTHRATVRGDPLSHGADDGGPVAAAGQHLTRQPRHGHAGIGPAAAADGSRHPPDGSVGSAAGASADVGGVAVGRHRRAAVPVLAHRPPGLHAGTSRVDRFVVAGRGCGDTRTGHQGRRSRDPRVAGIRLHRAPQHLAGRHAASARQAGQHRRSAVRRRGGPHRRRRRNRSRHWRSGRGALARARPVLRLHRCGPQRRRLRRRLVPHRRHRQARR